MSKKFDAKFFVKKRKQKYPRNKFFSYKSEKRIEKNFNYKDFRNSESYSTSFIRCSFFGTLFNKSTFRYCNFNKSVFSGITFINCNFRGCKFINAIFDNCVFKNCKLNKSSFKGADFINCYFDGTGLKSFPQLNLDHNKMKLKDSKNVPVGIIDDFRVRYQGTNVEKFINESNIYRLMKIARVVKIDEVFKELSSNTNIATIKFSHVLRTLQNSYKL